MRSVGRRGRRLRPLLDEFRAGLAARSRGWCEAGCGRRATDPHHLFGRGGTGLCLGDRWANRPELGADLCRPCHDSLHALKPDKQKLAALREAAVSRLALATGFPGPIDDDLRVAVRQVVRHAELAE